MRERIAQSLHNAVWLTLGMERQDYRIERPFSATLKQSSQSAVALASETRIAEVFNHPEVARQLLILGEPGAGKTTMMLELAEDLLQRTMEDKAEPIPVLVNLSSWKDPKQPIFEWLVDELKEKYGLRQNLAQQWLKDNQLLPLLDGLDEVDPQHQRACASAINAWLTGELEQKPCGVLICCRREEFEAVVQQPLSLYGAIYLQPLTPEQIESYFAQFGLQEVWQTVQQDQALQELLTTPLFLSMFGLVQTQQTFSLDEWKKRTTSDLKIRYLLDTYWNAAMTRELITNPAERQQGILSKTYGTKPLPSCESIRRSLIFTAKMLDRDSTTELLIEKMQPSALITGQQKQAYRMIAAFTGGLEIKPVEAIAIPRSREAWRESLQFLWQELGWSFWRGATFSLFLNLDSLNDPIKLILYGRLRLFLGMFSGLSWGLISSLIGGLRADIQTRIQPNQGIKNSIKNMLIVTTIALLLIRPFKLFLEPFLNDISPIYDPEAVDVIVIMCSVFLVAYSFLEGGGGALLRHLALRLVLAWNRYVPFRYDLLLNYCTERLLLQRIGGRYRFMHKTLQDYFAKMDLPN